MEYRVTTTFTYSNGMPGGIITNVVRGRKAAQTQLNANRLWLDKKSHTVNKETIEPVS
jgi:hypothetical protein